MSTLWLYARMQAMMFVFGIVGPIFLVLYFAIEPNMTMKWMYWWGLLITTADVLIALAITESVVRKDASKPVKAGKGDADEEAQDG